MKVTNLRVEFLSDPIGVPTEDLRFSWEITNIGEERNIYQSAYRIVVSSTINKLQTHDYDICDSGKVLNSSSNNITLNGLKLQNATVYYYKVYAWINATDAVITSAVACFETELCLDDFKAKWICLDKSKNTIQTKPDAYPLEIGYAAQYLRREFEIDSKVTSARLYITALGVYSCAINGESTSDYLAPGNFDFNSRVYYQTFDVTDYLTIGKNAISVKLGDGWYCGNLCGAGRQHYGEYPYFAGQIVINYQNGKQKVILSDENWKASTGAILWNDIFQGVCYDQSKELYGFDTVGFDDSKFEYATTGNFDKKLTSLLDAKIKNIDLLLPISIKKFDDSYIYDMGQNMVGVVSFKVRGLNSGDKIRLRFGEMICDDGKLYTENLRGGAQTDFVISSGEDFTFTPEFTYHGFRYVEVTGCEETPDLCDLSGIVLSSAIERSGYFETSDARINKLYSNAIWGQRGNFLSIPTDCPQRDERLGWTGDAQIFARSACFNYNSSQFFSKFLQDMVDAQRENGAYTDVVPHITKKDGNPLVGWGHAAWGDAGIIIVWNMYLCYGDINIIQKNFESMGRHISYFVNQGTEYTFEGFTYGDWLSVGELTPNILTDLAFLAYSVCLLAKMSNILGNTEKAEEYESLLIDIKKVFQKKCVVDENRLIGDTQTGYVLALKFELVNKDVRIKMAERLAEKIIENGYHITTGFIGVSYLLPMLCDYGYTDIAYKLVLQDTYPSWLCSVKNGATTIWERWDSYTAQNGFGDAGMNSFNHYSLGSCCEWMYRYMAGIDTDTIEVAYKKLIMRPRFIREFEYVKAKYHSIAGEIRAEWKYVGRAKYYKVSIPANSTAIIELESTSDGEVTENGIPLSKIYGILDVSRKENTLIIQVGSGNYEFKICN